MIKTRFYLCIFGMVLLLFGCKPAVLKQDIPVSTNPMHARIFVTDNRRDRRPVSWPWKGTGIIS